MKRSILAVILLLGGSAFGVNTFFAEHNTEQQFKDGTAENILIHSNGSLSLSYQSEVIYSGSDQDWVINDLASDSAGVIYAATSGDGELYRIGPNNKVESIWKDKDHSRHIFSVAVTNDSTLLAGTGGETGELYSYNSKKFKKIWSNDDVKFIWDILVSPTGKVYVATGPNGQIYSMDANGKNAELIYDAPVANIISLCLADMGILYAGGDEHGLVYKTDLASKTTTVAYDTGKAEVSSLALDKAGNIYIATADSSSARPGTKLILSDNNSSKNATEDKDGSEDKMSGDASAEKQPPATRAHTSRRPNNKQETDGNQVFKLSPEGYAEAIFAGPVIIHDIALNEKEDELYLATGFDGNLITINLNTLESVIVYDSESSQISALEMANNKLYLGCASQAALVSLDQEYVEEGTFISSVFDAKQPSLWGTMYLQGNAITGNVDFFSRSGNTSDPDNGGWSEWIKADISVPAVMVNSPIGRFLQYKLVIIRTNSQETPKISQIKASFSIPNLKPQVNELAIEGPQGGGNPKQEIPLEEMKKLQVSWQAEDANKDKLIFDIYIKESKSDCWIKIADNLDDNMYLWDTNLVPDGYYNVKLEASDELSNPEATKLTNCKTSDYVLVDNTAPEITEYNMADTANGKSIELTACDKLCVIKSVEYSLDSDRKLREAAPVDNIADSNIEKFSFSVDPQDTGLHFVTVKITDIAGNRGFVSYEFTK